MQSLCPRCGHYRQGPHRTEGCKVTPEVWTAVVEFAKANGRNWRSKLQVEWASTPMNTSIVGSEKRALLMEAKETIGKVRLHKIKLPL